jgi:hypothetical protein
LIVSDDAAARPIALSLISLLAESAWSVTLLAEVAALSNPGEEVDLV